VNEKEEREGRIWLERGIASARSGQRAEARQALFRALNHESQREMCWLWLAAVSEDAQQERVYLNKVLTLNPNNRFAKAGLAHLDAQPVQPIGAGDLGLLEAEPGSGENAATASPDVAATPPKPSQHPAPRSESPVSQSGAAQFTVQESTPVRAEPPAVAPAAEPPRRRPAKSPAVERPVAPPPISSSGPGAVGKDDGELSGWTVGRKPVPPQQPARAEGKSKVEPSGWSRSVPKVTASAESSQAVAAQPRAPRYEVNPPQDASNRASPPNGGFSGALSEVFQSHETWTAMAATVSLAGLAFVLIVLAVMSVFH
jgi:hypothetical protein